MKTLYLMRHGETLFNVQKKNQGWCDAPLTELGIKQAKVAREYYIKNNITFDVAYSSTSERACDTLEIVTDCQIPYTRIKGLKERNFGAFEGKDSFLNPPLPFGDFFKKFGGESDEDVRKRMNDTIFEIMTRENHDTVLIVSHGSACAQFARVWQAYWKTEFKPGIKNCAIFKYEFDGTHFYLVDIINHDFSNL